MTLRLALIGCVCALVLRGDEVTLRNGDRISGKVVQKDQKLLEFKSSVFGLIKIPWKEVAGLRTDTPVHVVLQDGEDVFGRLEATKDEVRIIGDDRQEESSFAELLAIRDAKEQREYERLLRPAWTQLWAGTGTVGMAGTQGNAEALTFTAGLKASRITRTDKTSIYFNAIRATAEVDGIAADTAEATRGGWAYSHDFASRFTWNLFNDYEYDRFQNLDLRFVLGGGGGFVVWKGERSQLDLVMGGAYNQEYFTPLEEDPFSRSTAEAYFGNDFNLRLTQVTSLNQTMRFFSNLNEPGDYRFNVDLGANTEITNWLTWNLSLSNRNLSNPVQGRRKNDFLYTTGIGVSFAR
jgi:putative salt-induced outer membrane protein YdiY